MSGFHKVIKLFETMCSKSYSCWILTTPYRESYSDDDGATWTPPEKTQLPNNNSGIQAAMLSSGNVAIVFNNLQGDGGRWPLSVALSADEGETWG